MEALLLFHPQERDLPAFLREKADCVFGIGGTGISLGDRPSSRPEMSVDDGAVDAALRREELSVVDAVLVFDAPLPLKEVSM